MRNTPFMVAAVAVAVAALLAGSAGAQERPKPHYTFNDGYTFEKAMRTLEEAAANRRSAVLDGYGFRRTDAERDDLALWLADMIVRDATRSADVKLLAAQWLARIWTQGWTVDGGVAYFESFRDALRMVFEEGEPTAACIRDTNAAWTVRDRLPVTDPRYRPRCARNPLKTAWCVAGAALHSPEVNRAMGRKTERPYATGSSFYADAEEAPEVPGLSGGAARWWESCWDDRRPGR